MKMKECACILCGCTDAMGCEGGCEWVCDLPPVCSSCAMPWMIASLWEIIDRLWIRTPASSQEIAWLRSTHRFIAKMGYLPNHSRIKKIQRAEKSLIQTARGTPAGAKRGARK